MSCPKHSISHLCWSCSRNVLCNIWHWTARGLILSAWKLFRQKLRSFSISHTVFGAAQCKALSGCPSHIMALSHHPEVWCWAKISSVSCSYCCLCMFVSEASEKAVFSWGTEVGYQQQTLYPQLSVGFTFFCLSQYSSFLKLYSRLLFIRLHYCQLLTCFTLAIPWTVKRGLQLQINVSWDTTENFLLRQAVVSLFPSSIFSFFLSLSLWVWFFLLLLYIWYSLMKPAFFFFFNKKPSFMISFPYTIWYFHVFNL